MKSIQQAGTPAQRGKAFGRLEVIFDSLYLLAAYGIGIFLLFKPSGLLRNLTLLMVFVLAIGDTFHLFPRIRSVISGQADKYIAAMGWGKLVSSISMTIFYVLLWQFGLKRFSVIPAIHETILIYLAAGLRIILLLFPQNRWLSKTPPLNWAIWRNLPFTVLGLIVANLYFVHSALVPRLSWMWLAILLSFAFYLPVVLFVERNRKLGMLMLPKTCMYIWMLIMLTNSLN